MDSQVLFQDRFIPVSSPKLLEALPGDEALAFIHQITLLHYHWRQKDPDAPSWSLWGARAREVEPGIEAMDFDRGLTFNEEFLAIEAAIAGQGAVLASDVLVQRELEAGLLKCLSPISLPGRTFYAVNIKNSLRKPLIDEFAQWARQTTDLGNTL